MASTFCKHFSWLLWGLLIVQVYFASAANYCHLTVIQDPLSRVGGHHPLTLEIQLRANFLKNGCFIPSNFFFDGTEKSCNRYVDELYPFGSDFDCIIQEGHMKLCTMNHALPVGAVVRIALNHVKYPESRGPRAISLTVINPDGTPADTAYNIADWTAMLPAELPDLAVKTSIDSFTCQMLSLEFTATPFLQIDDDGMIRLQLDDIIDTLSSSSTDLNIFHRGKGIVYGRTTDAYTNISPLSMRIENFKVPPYIKSFKVKLSTYSKYYYEVYENTLEVSIITLNTISNTRGVWHLDGKSICKEGLYKAEVASHCKEIPNARLEIVPPASLFGPQLATASYNQTLNEPATIEFNLTNPCFIPSREDLFKEDFTITVYSRNIAEPQLIIKSKLYGDVSYEPAELRDFKINVDRSGSGHMSSYTFSMTNSYVIPKGGRIAIALSPSVTLESNYGTTVNGVGTSINFFEGVIHVDVPMSISTPTNIKVAITGLKVPPEIGVYSGFVARSYNDLGYEMEKSLPASITINEPGTAAVTCTLDSVRNFEQSEYSFTFSSDSLKIANEDILGIKVPTEVADCSLASAEPATPPSTSEAFDYWLKAENLFTPDSTDFLSVKLNCRNPPTTALSSSFELSLFNAEGVKLLKGEVKMQTKKGSYLASGSSIRCDKTCPRCSSLCTLTLQRKTNTGFRTVEIISDRLDLSKLTCKYDESGQSYQSSCTALHDEAENKVKLTLNTQRKMYAIQIINLSLIYPGYSSSAYPLKIRTYATEDISSEALVDEDEAVVISGACDYPCKACSRGHGICDSCADDQLFYLYPDDAQSCTTSSSNNCRLLEDSNCCSGYYKEESSRQCLPCGSACTECEGSKDNCLKCKDGSKFLYRGECRDECGEGTYASINSDIKTCSSCSESCKVCYSAAECSECYSGYAFHEQEKTCVLECPKGTYRDGTTCKSCDSNCAVCQGSSTKCTECHSNKPERYLLPASSKCVEKEVCEDGKRIADDSTGSCISCSSDCEACRGETTFCTRCKDDKFLKESEGACVSTCAPDAYERPGENGVGGLCFHCEDDMLFLPSTKECMNSCPERHYESNKGCFPCKDYCGMCNDANTCLSCAEGYFLSKNQCYQGGCPAGAFSAIGNVCEDCDSSCLACQGNKYSCIECFANTFLSNHQCLSSCPIGTLLIDGKCEPCSSSCYSCAQNMDSCTACRENDSSYEGKCLSSCPVSTTASFARPKLCINCPTGCKECAWNISTDLHPERCISCLPGYKYLNSKCYPLCPSNYFDTSDGLACVSILPTSSENSFILNVPYPHLVTAGVLIALTVLKQKVSPRNLVSSNAVVVLSYTAISSYVSTMMFTEFEIEIVAIIVLALTIQIVLNLCFLKKYKEVIFADTGYKSWASFHNRLSCFILLLSSIFSFQTFRLLYSQFMNIESLFARFRDFNNLLKPLSRFSLLQMIMVQSIVVVLDIFEIVYRAKTKHTFIEESLILSLLLIVFLYFELKNADAVEAILKQTGNSVMLNNPTASGSGTSNNSGLNTNTKNCVVQKKSKSKALETDFSTKNIHTGVTTQQFEERKNEPSNVRPVSTTKGTHVTSEQYNLPSVPQFSNASFNVPTPINPELTVRGGFALQEVSNDISSDSQENQVVQLCDIPEFEERVALEKAKTKALWDERSDVKYPNEETPNVALCSNVANTPESSPSLFAIKEEDMKASFTLDDGREEVKNHNEVEIFLESSNRSRNVESMSEDRVKNKVTLNEARRNDFAYANGDRI